MVRVMDVAQRDVLTPREIEIVELAMEGCSAPQTARRLFLSTGTVKTHRQNILGKLRAANMTHAVAIYLGGVA